MFTLLKSASTKIFVIVILILAVGSFGLWKLYTGNLVETGSLQTENGTLQQNVVHTEESAKIADRVVTDYATEAKQSQLDIVNLRKETINEYVKKIEPVVPAKEASRKGDVPDGADRVGVLADRMYEYYCRARPGDTRCSAVTPVK
jgi:hypothetical protein